MSSRFVNQIVKDILDWGIEHNQGEGPDEEVLRGIVQNSVEKHIETGVEAISKLPEEAKADIAWFLQKQDEAKSTGMTLWAYFRSIEYTPQRDVAEMMTLFGQEVRKLSDMIADPKERLLTANLVIEEALEFCDALGFVPEQQENGSITLELSGREPDLVAAADAIGDILVVTYGAANRLGVNARAVFNEVHRSNLTKVWPDGSIHRRESDGKVIKPDTYSPANIVGVLCKVPRPKEEGVEVLTRLYPEFSLAQENGLDRWSALAAEAFGQHFDLTYEQIASRLNQNARLARTVAKWIVFMYGYGSPVLKLAELTDITENEAEKLVDVFAKRFPQLVPTALQSI